jgi:hypothetical protein
MCAVRGGTFVSIPFGGRRLWLGMESWFYVEAKSFLFSVGQGFAKLMVAESFRRGSSFGLTLYCVAAVDGGRGFAKSWVEDFVKSFKEGSKVTIVWRGGNRSSRFLEVAVYVVGSRRGLVLFLEGRDGRS